MDRPISDNSTLDRLFNALADQLRVHHGGLPEGFRGRMVTHFDNPWLTIRLASRLDLIHFKLFALADQGPGRHEDDLRRLNPTHEELLMAARWTQTHDPSEGFGQLIKAALRRMGAPDGSL